MVLIQVSRFHEQGRAIVLLVKFPREKEACEHEAFYAKERFRNVLVCTPR
jgi:hypothetical protein